MYGCSIKSALLYFTLILVVFMLNCYAYTGLIPPNPEHPGKCVYRGDTLKTGATPTVAPCQQLRCNDDGSILVVGCGKQRLENCNRGERINADQPYPACCLLRYKCKENDGTPYYIEKDVYDAAIKTKNTT